MSFVILSLDCSFFFFFSFVLFLIGSGLHPRPAKRQVYVHQSQVAAINCYQSLWEVKK